MARAGKLLLTLTRNVSTSVSKRMPITIGDTLPSVDLLEGSSLTKVNIKQLFEGKKGVIFAVPGAFTPGCSNTHLPGYVKDYQALKDKGVEIIACVSVNDVFVMEAWGEAKGASGKIRMLADHAAAFTKAVDMELDATPFLGGIRSKRYSMVVENGLVTAVNIEPDGTGLTCSLADSLLSQL